MCYMRIHVHVYTCHCVLFNISDWFVHQTVLSKKSLSINFLLEMTIMMPLSLCKGNVPTCISQQYIWGEVEVHFVRQSSKELILQVVHDYIVSSESSPTEVEITSLNALMCLWVLMKQNHSRHILPHVHVHIEGAGVFMYICKIYYKLVDLKQSTGSRALCQ